MFSPKSVVPDFEYLLERATTEAELADRFPDTKAADLHLELANAYLARVFGDHPALPGPAETQVVQENREAMRLAVGALSHLAQPAEVSHDPKFSSLLSSLSDTPKVVR